jgi:hypothetical protein
VARENAKKGIVAPEPEHAAAADEAGGSAEAKPAPAKKEFVAPPGFPHSSTTFHAQIVELMPFFNTHHRGYM